jgi:hypothetical protein
MVSWEDSLAQDLRLNVATVGVKCFHPGFYIVCGDGKLLLPLQEVLHGSDQTHFLYVCHGELLISETTTAKKSELEKNSQSKQHKRAESV